MTDIIDGISPSPTEPLDLSEQVAKLTAMVEAQTGLLHAILNQLVAPQTLEAAHLDFVRMVHGRRS